MVIRPASASCSSRLPENDRTGRGAFQPQQALSWPRLQSLAARTCSAPPPGLIFRWAPPAAFPAGRRRETPSCYCPTGTGRRWLVSCRGHFDLPRHTFGCWARALVSDRPATPNTDQEGRHLFLLPCFFANGKATSSEAEQRGLSRSQSQDRTFFFWCPWPLFAQQFFLNN